MMDVKKYRATTTLEALEMVKHELGEDAFVLGTKRVRSGGFLGYRAKSQVEISAAPSLPGNRPKPAQSAKNAFQSNRVLNLVDDAPAPPRPAMDADANTRESLLSVVSARAAAGNDFDELDPLGIQSIEQHKFETVEISTDAPRLVHPVRDACRPQAAAEVAPLLPAPPVSPVAPESLAPVAENFPATTTNRDFELLRAELREVKFSLGAFTSRQNTNHWQNEIDLDIFGQTFDGPLHNVYTALTGLGISGELARKFIADIKPTYDQQPVNSDHLLQLTLERGVSSMIRFEPSALDSDEPMTLAMIGPTGVGKTTTLAKLAARAALYQHRRVELVTLDTYRIAAVEQLKAYAEIIGANCHIARSVFELDAVLRRLPADATVFIDTAGRSPNDLADQFEISDFLLGRPEIRKCLAVQATTNPTDAASSIKKFEMYGADCLVLTKLDETVRPGAMIEAVAEGGLPLAYLCAGQRVPEDLQVATPETLANRTLGRRDNSRIAAQVTLNQ